MPTKPRQVEPFRYFNYALLQTRGLHQFFDLMRYERAFICRRADCQKIIKVIGDQAACILDNYEILLCRYSHTKKPDWCEARLLSHQKLEHITELGKLYSLCPDIETFTAIPPFRYVQEHTVNGPACDIVNYLYSNRAVPNSEHDAHLIGELFTGCLVSSEVTLLTFTRLPEYHWVTNPRLSPDK